MFFRLFRSIWYPVLLMYASSSHYPIRANPTFPVGVLLPFQSLCPLRDNCISTSLTLCTPSYIAVVLWVLRHHALTRLGDPEVPVTSRSRFRFPTHPLSRSLRVDTRGRFEMPVNLASQLWYILDCRVIGWDAGWPPRIRVQAV